jgi:hypothetical protein
LIVIGSPSTGSELIVCCRSCTLGGFIVDGDDCIQLVVVRRSPLREMGKQLSAAYFTVS